MKIGILTFHRAINYGAVLQAYALCTYINKCGKKAEIIDYYCKDVYDYYKPWFCNPQLYGIKTPLKCIKNIFYYRKKRKKINNFNTFLLLNNLSERISSIEQLKECTKSYDYVITGSDQVWNPDICSGKAKDIYLLNSVNDMTKKISYAASIGESILSDEYKQYLKDSISSYSAISVREKSVKEIVSNQCACLVCDPIFLDRTVWKAFIGERPCREEYIVYYSMDRNCEMKQFVLSFAKKHKYKIINLNMEAHFGYLEVDASCVGPGDFVSIFYHAKYIVTNSFHGMAYALIFNKNFVAFKHRSRETRQVELAKKYEISNRIVNSLKEAFLVLEKPIDYEKVNQLIEDDVSFSRQFLNDVLL